MLTKLTEWDSRPDHLRAMAYEWCSVLCKNYPNLKNGKELLFLSLEIGFRGLDLQCLWGDVQPFHTKHFKHMAKIVFKNGNDEVVADFLQAWATCSFVRGSSELPGALARHLTRHEHVAYTTSLRLRRLTVHSIGCLGFRPFELAGVERFTMLLDHLGVGADDMSDTNSQGRWLSLLVDVVKSPEGWQSLGLSYWELIPELGAAMVGFICPNNQNLQVMVSLEEQQDWDRLECWVCFVWPLHRPEINAVPENLERMTLSLLRQRPGVAKKLERWLRSPYMGDVSKCLEFLREICERAGLEAASWPDTL